VTHTRPDNQRGIHATRWHSAGLGALLLASCTGTLGDDAASQDGKGPQGALDCTQPTPGERALPRLTAAQYARSVQRLFGSDVSLGDEYPKSQSGKNVFRTDADANVVTLDGALGIQAAAERVAAEVTTDLTALLGCEPSGAADDSCIRGFVEDLAKRAYRRAPTEQEVQRLSDLYAVVLTNLSEPRAGIRSVIEAVLQSPQFLYLVEELPADTPSGTVVPVGGQHLANRLAYLFTDAPPDEALLARAESGELEDPAVVRAEAERLLNEYGLESVLHTFFHDWLHTSRIDEVEKSQELFPAFGALRPSMETQLTRFASQVFQSGGRIADLLTTTRIPLDAALASFYGASAPEEDWSPVELGPARAGLLTLPIFLASHANSATTSPVARGAFIRESLLCQHLVPPANVDINLPVSKPGESVRQRLATHASDPSCANCHRLIDPPGFALENYDAIGQWREEEETGAPVDASGELVGAGSAEGDFSGPADFIPLLATSDLVAECFARQWLRFSLRRQDTRQDACSVAVVQDAVVEHEGSLRELLLALTQTDAFLYRSIPEAE
jgi:hypothetical protein